MPPLEQVEQSLAGAALQVPARQVWLTQSVASGSHEVPSVTGVATHAPVAALQVPRTQSPSSERQSGAGPGMQVPAVQLSPTVQGHSIRSHCGSSGG